MSITMPPNTKMTGRIQKAVVKSRRQDSSATSSSIGAGSTAAPSPPATRTRPPWRTHPPRGRSEARPRLTKLPTRRCSSKHLRRSPLLPRVDTQMPGWNHGGNGTPTSLGADRGRSILLSATGGAAIIVLVIVAALSILLPLGVVTVWRWRTVGLVNHMMLEHGLSVRLALPLPRRVHVTQAHQALHLRR